MQKEGAYGQFRRSFVLGLAMGAAAFLLPLTVMGGGEAAVEVLPPEPTPVVSAPAEDSSRWDGERTLRVLQKDGAVEQMAFSDYLWRVVAAEMPASFEPEALRAQAVCARTYSLWKLAAGSHEADGADICADSTCCQAYIDPADAAQRWAGLAEEYSAKITQAVADTDGQVLTYEGKPIQAVFFSSSTSSTEAAAEVWGNSLPYLVSVDSPEGDEVPNYHSTVTLTAGELAELVKAEYAGADLSGDPAGWLTDVSYTASGRVAELNVGGVTLSGGAARSLFGLRSACFRVEEADGVFTFSVTGYGHGVGMSQYGANAMAKAGSDWREIVSHYYTGVTIEQGKGV